ncbi:MAG: DUF4340 domain-containing protein [Bacteroidota bacterium]
MKKLSNTILLVSLVILVAIFAASRLFRSPGLESNLRKDLVKVDTAVISEIRILPSKDHVEEVKVVHVGNAWKVSKGSRTELGNTTMVKSMLSSLSNLQAQRMASRKKEKWSDYNVGENSTHVSVYQGNIRVADFHVGKLGFTQSSSGGFGGAYTYVRLSDENEVYTVEGFLESSFNNSFDDLRDKTILKLNKVDIVRISFHYPADSSFVMDKRDSVWFIGNEIVEASKVESFLNQFSSKYLTEFEDGFSVERPADITLQVDGEKGGLATVEAWKKDGEWIFSSSLQKGVYFSSKGSSIVTDLLIGRKKLIQNGIK